MSEETQDSSEVKVAKGEWVRVHTVEGEFREVKGPWHVDLQGPFKLLYHDENDGKCKIGGGINTWNHYSTCQKFLGNYVSIFLCSYHVTCHNVQWR